MQRISSRKNTFLLIAALSILSIAAGCTSTSTTIKDNRSRTVTVDTNRRKIDAILHWLDRISLNARSLQTSGHLTAAQGDDSHSASFVMKSKRALVDNRNPYTSIRVDSLSVEVSGPFGITVARFLASPEEYIFYDALHGDVSHGKTDARSLENLTQLRGITLSTMSDVIYGLAPGANEIDPQDSLELFSLTQDQHVLLIRHHLTNGTEAVYLDGVLPELQQEINLTTLRVSRYERWNSWLNVFDQSRPKPNVTVRYSSPKVMDWLQLPMVIEAVAGNNSLMLEYTDVTLNPDQLTVRVKMPKQ